MKTIKVIGKALAVLVVVLACLILVFLMRYPATQFREATSAGQIPGFTVLGHRNVMFGLTCHDAWHLGHTSQTFAELLAHSSIARDDDERITDETREKFAKLFSIQKDSLREYTMYYNKNFHGYYEYLLVSPNRTESYYGAGEW